MKIKAWHLFSLIFIGSWFPIEGLFQPIVHILPIIILLLGIPLGISYIEKKSFLVFAAIVSWIVAYSLLVNGFSFAINTITSLIFHFPVLMLVFRVKNIDKKDLRRFMRVVAVVSIIQLVIGIIQLILFQGFTFNFIANAWDKVTGTTASHSSHVYSVKMIFQAVFLFYGRACFNDSKSKLLTSIAFISAVIGAFISSYLVGIVLVVFSIIGINIFTYLKKTLNGVFALRMNIRKVAKYFSIFIISVLLLISSISLFKKTQTRNYDLLLYVFNNALSLDFSDSYKFQKVQSIINTVQNVMPEDKLRTIFGFGAGQYSSRTALVYTGDYLTPHPSYLPISMTEYTRKHIWPLWDYSARKRFRGSVLALPTSSILSFIMEFGLIIFVVCSIAILITIAKFRYEAVNLKQSKQFEYAKPLEIVLLCAFSQIILDLWLEYGSFTVFIYLIFIIRSSNFPQITEEDHL